MKNALRLALVMAVMCSLVTANEPVVTVGINIAPTLKSHRQQLLERNENSITTVVETIDLIGIDATAITTVTTLRDGTNFTDEFRTTVNINSGSCDDCTLYIDHNHYGYTSDMYQNSPYISACNMDYYEIFWPGQTIHHRDGYTFPADYPLVTASDGGLYAGDSYYLESGLDIPYDYQDTYILFYRYTVVYSDGSMDIYPNDSESDYEDQQGWPVYVTGWELRPNIFIDEVVLSNADGEITSDNPVYTDDNVRLRVYITENEGFWAGNDIVVEYYKDESSSDYDWDETSEIDAYETDDERSDYTSFSSAGQHSITVKIDVDDDVNETDESSSDNEYTIYFSVQEAPAAPTVSIDQVQRTSWRNATVYWTGHDGNGDALEYRSKLDSETWSTWSGSTSRSFTNISSGPHTFYVEVRDPGGLTGSDNESFTIEYAVNVTDISDQTLVYGQTLEFDIGVTGGSGNYNYSANFGSIDANGHYSWTPPYSPNPYNEMVTVNCSDWPVNYDSDGFSVTVTLPDVVIEGVEDNYDVSEHDALSDASITASGGDGSSYSWILTPNTTGGGWLALTSYNGSLTGLSGTAPYVSEETVYAYTLSCVSLSVSAAVDFTVTVFNTVITVETDADTVWAIMNQEMDGFTVTAHGLEQGECIWSLGMPPTSNIGNNYWMGVGTIAGNYDTTANITGTPQSAFELPIYAGNFDAWQINGVKTVLINAFPAVFFNVQPSYSFFQYQAGQIVLNAGGGNGSDYVWSVEDSTLLTIDSTSNNTVWLSVNTATGGEYQVDVTCQQADFLQNSHTEQVNFSVEGSFWSVQPMQVNFPAVQDTELVIISNTTVNGSPFNYTLSLSNWGYYNILSPLSGNISSGNADTVMVVNYENNDPYPLSAQLTVSINGGAYASIVSLTTEAATTSLQMFSFNGGLSASQPLTVWNNTDVEQIVSLNHSNDIFSVSDTEISLQSGDSAIVEVNAASADALIVDTLFVQSDNLNSKVLLRKYETPLNSITYDDGLPDASIPHNDYIVNRFNVVTGDAMTGMSVHLPINNQSFAWVVLDNELVEIASGETNNNFVGWQRITFLSSFEGNEIYYVGIKPIEEDEVIYVGYEVGTDSSSYWYSNGDFEMMPGLCFIRALTNGAVGVDNDVYQAESYILSQNYPNPFNPSTSISYTLPKQSYVNLTIYALNGRAVLTLVNGEQAGGDHRMTVDLGSKNLSSGVYFYRLATPEWSATKKLMYIK